MARRDITGVVDFAYLESYAAGDLEVVAEVLELFRQQAALWAPLIAPGQEGWPDAVHTIKGTARGIGAAALAQACAVAELEGEGRLAEVRDALDAALTDVAAYVHELMLRSLKSPPRAG
ncbi:MAG: Hpt domain-containing protein [Phenylobacterium sp.]|uniref:Hpt domain-containing protein n=1 Tax=Phenylobacterium sp. TaxID=1871053 RepID=UPI002726DCC8|nr:Hpt domain-containing protein [Phenylobacterium sp.]MDO8902796.1 Hpt domain-containing protein [Phenylobacterium sp.]